MVCRDGEGESGDRAEGVQGRCTRLDKSAARFLKEEADALSLKLQPCKSPKMEEETRATGAHLHIELVKQMQESSSMALSSSSFHFPQPRPGRNSSMGSIKDFQEGEGGTDIFVPLIL